MAHKQVFISYSSTDKAQADLIRAFLEEHGFSCFMAPRDIPGGRWWPEVLLEALYAAEIVVLVFSERGNQSPQIAREVNITVHRNIPLIPYRIENVLPRGLMEYFLCLPQWLDDFQPLSTEKSQQLLAAVREACRRPSPPPPSSVAPPPAEAAFAAVDSPRLIASLGQAMLEERQPLVPFERLSPAERAAARQLIAARELREVTSPQSPDSRYVGFIEEEACLRALVSAMELQPECAPSEWLAQCAEFPLLADAVALALLKDDRAHV